MVDKQNKRFTLVSLVLHPIDTLVGDDIGQIAFLYHSIVLHGNKARVIIIALLRQNIPIIESGWQTYQMPLSDNGCLIAGFLQQFGHCLLASVKDSVLIVCKTVLMAVLSGKHTGTARSGKRIGHKAIDELDSVVGNAVQIRGLHITLVITAHHLCCMIIRHDIHNIIGLMGSFLLRQCGT